MYLYFYRNRDPLSLKYIKVMRILLWTVGEWPGEIFGERVPLFIRFMRYFCPTQASIILVGQYIYLYKFCKTTSFYVLGHIIIMTFLNAVTIVSIFYRRWYGRHFLTD